MQISDGVRISIQHFKILFFKISTPSVYYKKYYTRRLLNCHKKKNDATCFNLETAVEDDDLTQSFEP
jgi:hypothetical protein